MTEMRGNIQDKWKEEFISKAKLISKSSKANFTFENAINCSHSFRNKFDELMIEYFKFIENAPLKDNDYYGYVTSYQKGKKLKEKYFRHSSKKLQEYYKKVDDNECAIFSLEDYHQYVLFMMLKLKGLYKEEYDKTFGVKVTDSREYSPLTKIPSVLRPYLPLKIKEYDISRANPTFIDIDLGLTNRQVDVYSLIDKKKFNTLINLHKDIKETTYEKIVKDLEIVYGERASEVMTLERYNTKGKLFRDLTLHEDNAINQFIHKNNLKEYVRLHDGVYVRDHVECEFMEFNQVTFKVKECLKEELKENYPIPFYERVNGKLVTSPVQYSKFFSQENFIRGIEQGNDNLIIFKNTTNILKEFNYKTETVGFLKNEINEFNSEEIENRIAKESRTAISQAYLLLPSKEISYHLDNKDEFGLSFKNGYFKLSNREINKIEYSDIKGFFPAHKTQEHNFSESSYESEFEQFIKMVCINRDARDTELTKEEKKIFDQFCAMIGYMCYTYKDPNFTPAIILSDDGANDINRNGGRGKTILVNALMHVQKAMLRGPHEFNPNYTHNFADLKNDTRIFIIDDVEAGFKYDDLYTNITGSISCQRKGTEAVTIPFNEAPKFIITTNWAVRYDEKNTSTKRRFREFKFSDFFNEDNTPMMVFGDRFFDDWDDKEWNLFYNFIFICVENYRLHGLDQIEYNKSEDNFKACFSNDIILEEFERILKGCRANRKGFSVSDFMGAYKHHENPLRHEKYFHHRNVKRLIEVYVKKNNTKIKYINSYKKWVPNPDHR